MKHIQEPGWWQLSHATAGRTITNRSLIKKEVYSPPGGPFQPSPASSCSELLWSGRDANAQQPVVSCLYLFCVENQFHQAFAVVEGFGFRQHDVRFDSSVHIVEGAVANQSHLIGTGDLKLSAGSAGAGQNHAGAAGALADQGDFVGILEERGHQIAAGEGARGDQAVNSHGFSRNNGKYCRMLCKSSSILPIMLI